MRKLAFAVAASLLLSSGAQAETQFGVYSGPGQYGVKGVSAFVKWFGHPIDRVLDFTAGNTWGDMVSDTSAVAYAWYKASPVGANGKRKLIPLTLSVPLVANGSSIAKVASGSANTYFKQVGQNLAHLGYTNAYIRLGWEFSGGWYPWAARNDLKNWTAAWKQAVGALRSVPGTNFKFVWCIAGGNAPEKLENLYPGDGYVDIIAGDFYDLNWNYPAPSAATRWQMVLDSSTQFGNYGLTWLANFGAQHNKPLAIPEWGTGMYHPLNRGINPGGGDDPAFITNMAKWIGSHNVAFATYFNATSANYQTTIDSNLIPKAGAALKANYKSLTTTP